jgi:hypothetical protein
LVVGNAKLEPSVSETGLAVKGVLASNTTRSVFRAVKPRDERASVEKLVEWKTCAHFFFGFPEDSFAVSVDNDEVELVVVVAVEVDALEETDDCVPSRLGALGSFFSADPKNFLGVTNFAFVNTSLISAPFCCQAARYTSRTRGQMDLSKAKQRTNHVSTLRLALRTTGRDGALALLQSNHSEDATYAPRPVIVLEPRSTELEVVKIRHRCEA